VASRYLVKSNRTVGVLAKPAAGLPSLSTVRERPMETVRVAP
jgi:hypothetical protein